MLTSSKPFEGVLLSPPLGRPVGSSSGGAEQRAAPCVIVVCRSSFAVLRSFVMGDGADNTKQFQFELLVALLKPKILGIGCVISDIPATMSE